MEVPLSTDICRCCLSPGNYKSLKETFQWMGENENYGEMLKECFDVTLCDTDNDCHGGICELCITQLRNARNFKKQVLKSDEIFKRGLDSHFKGGEVKIEFINENYLDSDIGNQDDYFAGLETEEEADIPIKEEVTVVETKNRKRAVKQPVKEETATKKKKPEANTSDKGDNLKNDEDTKNVTDRKKQILDEKLRRYRILIALLELSNATPLKNRNDKGFHCAYCSETFLNPAELKSHVLKEHHDVKVKYNHLRKLLHSDSIKIDITGLQCNICRKQLRELTDLNDHVSQAHGKDLKAHDKDRIIPFRFEEPEGMKCAVCSQTFVSFNMLLRHMNMHYRNYVCEKCQAGFVAERLLKYHLKESHAQGEFRCSSCEKVFSTRTKRRDHERAVHCGFKRNKCPYCPERFTSHLQRSNHIVKFHSKHSVVYRCNGCEKSFDARKKLTQHVRAYHLMEKMHACTECDKSFFRKVCLDNHMLKHTGEKRYVCDVCSKSYGRKFTLREHMRIHINDRRFKCKECSQAFVQKCSWRSHMRTRHNMTV